MIQIDENLIVSIVETAADEIHHLAKRLKKYEPIDSQTTDTIAELLRVKQMVIYVLKAEAEKIKAEEGLN